VGTKQDIIPTNTIHCGLTTIIGETVTIGRIKTLTASTTMTTALGMKINIETNVEKSNRNPLKVAGCGLRF
jgi:hypothetical protein